MKNVIIFTVLLGIFLVRFYSSRQIFTNGTRIKISTVLSSEPIRYESSQYIKFNGLKIYLPLYPEIYYGDKVVIEGIVSGDKLKDVKLLKIEESVNPIFSFRNKLISFIKRKIPEPSASLVAGVTLGSKSDIPENFWNSLKKTGTAHVVVASGMNVTLVAGFLLSLLTLFTKRKKAIILSIAAIWIYVAMSGMDAPIIRAGVMTSIAFMGSFFGRLTSTWRIYFLTGVLMLIAKPVWVTDLGFWLSFVATASLMLFEKKIAGYLKKVPALLREGLSTSLAAQIGVAPILFVTFGYFNILSPVVNALVLWTIAPITIISMIAIFVGAISEPLGWGLLLLTYPLTSWFIFVTKVFS